MPKLAFLVKMDTDHPAFRGGVTSADALLDYLIGTGGKYRDCVSVEDVESDIPEPYRSWDGWDISPEMRRRGYPASKWQAQQPPLLLTSPVPDEAGPTVADRDLHRVQIQFEAMLDHATGTLYAADRTVIIGDLGPESDRLSVENVDLDVIDLPDQQQD